VADIFVSYTSSDRNWADWIGQRLEKLGHTARLFGWEVSAGGDVMEWMDERHDEADHVLCVVSSRYLDKERRYSAMERRAAQLAAASGRPNFLLPVFVEACEGSTLFATLRRCDLHGLSEDEACAELTKFLKPAGPPTGAVPFPGAKKDRASGASPPRAPVAFPGTADSQLGEVAGAISNIPISVPRHFLGRDEDLAAIDKALRNNSGRAAIAALHGLRGVGKSTLAAAYAEQHSSDYRASWWIRAETESTRRADLVGLGVRLGWVAAEEKEEQALALVMQQLRDEGDGILLVFDNANNAKEFGKYAPRGGALRILVTSNAPDWRGVAVPVEIEVWPSQTGADYLIERTGCHDESSAALALSDMLGGLPLAHEQAAAYCERVGTSLAEYAKRFSEKPGIFLDDARAAPEQYRNGLTVAKTFALAIDEADKDRPGAELLIVYASLLASEPIPLFLLSEIKGQPGDKFHTAIEQEGLDEAIAALRAFALIERESISDERQPKIRTDSVNLHRLVRKIAMTRLAPAQNERMRGELIAAMLAVYPKEVLNDPSVWARARRLDPHGMALVGDAVSLPSGFEILSAELLTLLLAYRHAAPSSAVEAPALAERALKLRQDKLSETHPDTVSSLVDLAWVLRDSGDLLRSETLARHAVEISEKIFGPNDIKTASSLNTLALTLHERGKLNDAKVLFERDLAISQKELGEQDKETAVSHKSLAQLLHDLDDLSGAREHYERALSIFETVSGAAHPDVATSACDLASVLRDQGRFAEALPLYERALRIAQSELGPTHPVTGTILHNMGRLMQAQEKFDEALSLYRRTLDIFGQKLRAHNPETQTLIDDLGGLLHDLERFDEALPLYQRALSETERNFGADHPETATALNNLGRLLDDQGELEKALPLYRRALKILEQRADGPETGLVLSNLGLLLHRLNKLGEALPIYQRALKISEQHLGVDHEETGTALNNLGELLYDQKKFDDALPLFMRALEICEQTSGPKDPETALVLSNVARTLRAKGEHKQARAFSQRAREIWQTSDE
jgi:tetratricopeptide (TPR) repeat protein